MSILTGFEGLKPSRQKCNTLFMFKDIQIRHPDKYSIKNRI